MSKRKVRRLYRECVERYASGAYDATRQTGDLAYRGRLLALVSGLCYRAGWDDARAGTLADSGTIPLELWVQALANETLRRSQGQGHYY